MLDRGACHGQPELVALFFSDVADEQDEARAICHGCPVRQECYWSAIERKEPVGVWGGALFPDEWRRGMRRLAAILTGLDDPDAAGDPGGDDLPSLRSA